MPSKRPFQVLEDRPLTVNEICEATISEKVVSSAKNVRSLIPTDAFPLDAVPLLEHSTPVFEPAFRVPRASFEALILVQSPLQLLTCFFTFTALEIVVFATNEAAEDWYHNAPVHGKPRPWHPTTTSEILRWLGILFPMSRCTIRSTPEWWSSKAGCRRSECKGRERWEQIHRFLSITSNKCPKKSDPWWTKLTPLTLTIRRACQQAVRPSSWVVVDDAMFSFHGRSKNKTTIKNKPISKGIKIWILAYDGYVHDWLWHSEEASIGPECARKINITASTPGRMPARLAPTF